MLAHDRVLNGETAKRGADLAIDVAHVGIALAELHQHVVPGKIASGGVEEAVLGKLRLAWAVLEGRVIDDEGQLGMVEGGFFDVGGIGKMSERARLRGVTFVDAENLEAELFGLLVE